MSNAITHRIGTLGIHLGTNRIASEHHGFVFVRHAGRWERYSRSAGLEIFERYASPADLELIARLQNRAVPC